MDDELILNIDLDYTKPKKKSNGTTKSVESPSLPAPLRQKQSRPLHIGRGEESGPPRKRQRVLSTFKPKVPRVGTSVISDPPQQETSEGQGSAQTSKPTGHVISSLFTSNPVVELPPAPIESTKLQAPSNAPLRDDSTFEGLGLNPLLTSHLRDKMNILKPTAVQRASLSAILHQSRSDRRDLFIQSQTGSGKTLSFLLPIIHDLLPLSSLSYIDRSIGTLAIIVAPTRELAQQISEVLNTLLQMRLRESNPDASDGDLGPRLTRWLVSGLLVGGGTRTHDKARLRKGLPILVATPGRLLDHLQNTESFKVAKCRWLVLDEADRLMELGFQETLEGIIKALDGRRNLALAAAKNGDTFGGEVIGGWNWGPRRQTILCSATIREDVQKLAGTALHNPLTIKGVANEPAPSVTARAIQPSSGSPSAPENSITNFTPPSQLSQKYLVVPLKLRLVTLVALLRAILTQAQRSPTAGNKIIVFFSCTDSWVEEGMQGESSKEGNEAGESSVTAKASAGKLVPVDYEKILLSGFGGSSKGDAGQRATDIQLAFERWVLREKSHSALAQKGFQSHMRAYATHPSDEKHIFHVRNLHIGHLAKAFALRDAPGNIKGAPSQASTSASKQTAAPQTERMKAKAKYIPVSKKDATGANSVAPRASKVKERSAKKLTVAERMQEVMKAQGKLTKKDGHIVSGGGANEFQVAGANALERLAR
ncbi:ATP-dependent RNA helicase dbp7 [Tulasnella sp. 417]|nr:ATP-dependent RNA helicase dbp7 [Tulasnella sp. 417]